MKKADLRLLSPEARYERRMEVVRLHQAGGVSYTQIAERTGLEVTDVRLLLTEVHDERRAEAIRLRKAALSYKRLAERTGVEKTNMRLLSPEARYERRVEVIRLRKAGLSYKRITERTGVSHMSVFNICSRYASGGDASLKDPVCGRLPAAQEKTLRNFIQERRSEHPYTLWTRAAFAQLVQERTGVTLSVRTIDAYLRHWGLTRHKRTRSTYEKSPTIKKWVEKDYPMIAARAESEGAEVHWADEKGLVRDNVRARGSEPQRPGQMVRLSKLSVISSITNKGMVRWKIFDGDLNAAILIDFMRRLIRSAGCKVYLILDNLKVHHSKPVQAWLAEHAEEIEVFYLPSYPGLNPDEMANARLIQALTTTAHVRTDLQLVKATTRYLRSLHKHPENIRKYFEHEKLCYAA